MTRLAQGVRVCLLGACVAGLIGVAAAQAQTIEETAGMRQIEVSGGAVTIHKGTYATAEGPVEVTQTRILEVAPADTVLVKDEPIRLADKKPESWHSGTPLPSCGTRGINAQGAFEPGSLTIASSPGGPSLVEGKDYLVSDEFGMVGLGPDSSVTPETEVYANYRFGLLRLDALYIDADGRPGIVRGVSHISTPLPAEVPEGARRLANVFRSHHATNVQKEDVFPILELAREAVTATTAGRIPKTVAKIKAGLPVKIVCWGDSVTCGGDASTPSMTYVEQFRRMLLDAMPLSGKLNVINISYGGSNSMQWLRLPPYDNAWFEQNAVYPADQVDFQRILDLEPDLLTIEFVNDAGLDAEGVDRVYGTILERLRPLGTEVILITPHFTASSMMGLTSLRDPEPRTYVKALAAFAERHNLALADASSRWGHLWREGVPYVTLLYNTINHPDDRGHRLFAEELLKCFE
jgi:lysophospholipase L1-like esterase